jgi:SAM-dependent methyltransferase
VTQGVRVVEVDDDGVHVVSTEDTVLDILFDGRRIWSFWTVRDTERRGQQSVAAWPVQLRKFLQGATRLSVVEHVSGRVLLDEEVTLGSGTGRIAVVDAQGRDLGIDKSNRLAKTFDTRDSEHVTPLLDAIGQVLGALHEGGVDAFLAYGTLLGAVREGDFIGHDSDIDLGYVSRHHHPVEVIRESFRLERELKEKGLLVDRYSAAAFKVDVTEADGSVRGLDVFGGYFLDGRLYLMGEIGTPFEEDWVFPLSTGTLAGRTFPVPAKPERVLEATYGPSWRVPDPAFHFETPRTTHRRLNGWFRGMRTHRADWDRRNSGKRDVLPSLEPSPLARYVLEQEGRPRRLVDVGAGRGGDALWFARQGIPTLALDHSRGADNAVRRVVAEEGLDYETLWFNLHELRSVIAQAIRVAHLGGPPTLMSNHLLDATDRRGLVSFARFARLALSGGGRLYADFYSAEPGAGRGQRGRDLLQPIQADGVVRALQRAGADIVLNTQIQQERDDGRTGRPVARVVAEWRA